MGRSYWIIYLLINPFQSIHPLNGTLEVLLKS